MSPETVTSLFPDRPIHPLPKRRLRERLSPEVADSIEYPPTPTTVTQLFPYPYNVRDEDIEHHKSSPHRARGSGAGGEVGRGLENEEDDPSRVRRSLVPRSAPSIGRSGRPSPRADSSRQAHQQAPSSAASSVDGYESIETNNKKKRKVPESALGVHSLNDASSSTAGPMTPSTPSRAINNENGSYSYRSLGSGGSGMSGPGRGRFARNRCGRSPLSEGSRNTKLQPARWSPLPTPSSGIISNAIARVDKYPPPQEGQENVSLLQQSSKSSPASIQFTFTCESQVPGTVNWPSPYGKTTPSMANPTGEPLAPSKPGKSNWTGAGQHGAAAPNSSRGGVGGPPAAAPKKTRRRAKAGPSREYAEAAAERKRQTASKNAQSPPKQEDIWICHFCEYEDIFGEPPVALIRQYEMKDLKKRKDEENRKRLLEKAKAKGRKNKKSGKAAAKSSGHDQAHAHDHEHDLDDSHSHCLGHHDDDGGHHGPPTPDHHDGHVCSSCGQLNEAEPRPAENKPPDIPVGVGPGAGASKSVGKAAGGAGSSAGAGGHHDSLHV